MSTFLNSVVKIEDKITIELRYAAEYDTELPYTKYIDINKYYTYKVTHVENDKLIEDTGRIINALYTNKQSPFVRDTIYDTTDLANKWPEGEKYIPSTITLDCSKYYENNVKNIDIVNIRDIVLVERELEDFNEGDIVTVTMLDGTVYTEFIVNNYIALAGGECYIEIIKSTEYDNTSDTYHDELINTKDIANIEVIHEVAPFEYSVGDILKIRYRFINPEIEPADMYCKVLALIDPTNTFNVKTVEGMIVSNIDGTTRTILYTAYMDSIELCELDEEESDDDTTDDTEIPDDDTDTDIDDQDKPEIKDDSDIPPIVDDGEDNTDTTVDATIEDKIDTPIVEE